MVSNSLAELDRAHVVHPVVNWARHEARGPTILSSARGVYLTDDRGNELLDGFAGLWCVNVGYGHESIVAAAAEQMRRLPYATGYFHYASEPTIRLAARLADIAPGDLNHVYFTLGGSDAVDSVIKMVRSYFNIRGEPKKKNFIALQRGYHGSSSVGSGLTALPVFHANFDLPAPWQFHIASPYPYRHPAGPAPDKVIEASVAELRSKVAELGVETVAAFICEPVQGSGGVIVPPKGWLKAMSETCRDLGILFIADEVITGFGRTGPMFACAGEGVVPDVMTVAKGLTSGYAPMGAVLLSDGFHATIRDGLAEGLPYGHGFTYSGHPVSAAVGLEVLRLYDEGGILANAQRVAPAFASGLSALASHPLVGDVRVIGLLAGIELVVDKAAKTKPPPSLKLSEHLTAAGYRRGLIFRAFADDIIGLAPPLSISAGEVDLLLARLRATLDDLLNIEDVCNALD